MKFLFNFAYLDAATPWQLGFQDPATPIIIGIIHFHNHLIFFLVIIGTFVFWLLYKALVLFKEDPSREASKFTHSTPLEVVWTVTPALLLLLIAGPSFALLYSIDEVIAPHISLKVIGHQWYWSYEYSDYQEPVSGESIKFDSYIVAEDDLSLGGLRLLEVDNRVKLPVNVHIRVLVSSADVLHSWAVPSLGIKIDACPGRLNQVSLFLMRKGVFYGQCSEICGVNHAFIPIVVESLSEESYLNWVKATLPSESVDSSSSSPVEAAGSTEPNSLPSPANESSSNPKNGENASSLDKVKLEPTKVKTWKDPFPDPHGPLSIEWFKETLWYQREMKEHNHNLIPDILASMYYDCTDTELSKALGGDYECYLQYIKNFKTIIVEKQQLDQAQLFRELLTKMLDATDKYEATHKNANVVTSSEVVSPAEKKE